MVSEFLVLTTLLLVNPQFSSQFHRRDVWRSVGSLRGFVGSPRKFTTCVLWYTKRAAAPPPTPGLCRSCGGVIRSSIRNVGISFGSRTVCQRTKTQARLSSLHHASFVTQVIWPNPNHTQYAAGPNLPMRMLACVISEATHLNSASRHLLSSLE